MNSFAFHIPETCKWFPSWAEPALTGHYRKYPQEVGGGGGLDTRFLTEMKEVEALRTYTLVRGQPSQNPVFLISYTNSVFSHSLKLVASSSFGHLFLYPEGVHS